MSSTNWYCLLLSCLLSVYLVSATDSYCGYDYFDAVTNCGLECSSGQDLDCRDLGSDYSCFMFTGCTAKLMETAPMDVNSTDTNPSVVEANDLNSTIASATTNSPTASPTDSPVKTKRPTSSPTPNPYLVSLQTSTRKEMNGKTGNATSTSFGYVFNMRTTSESQAIIVVGLDFLTASTETLKFELYFSMNSYVQSKGKFGNWNLVGKGAITGKGMGRLTSITPDLIDPIPIDGQGSTRAFYLTLNTEDLVFRMTASGSAPDEVVQVASDEVEIYEGESVQTFPFTEGGAPGDYVGPSQFIGAVHYDSLPCKPFDDHGTIYNLPCPIIPTISPAPSTNAPTTLTPTLSRVPSMSPSLEVTPEASSQFTMHYYSCIKV